MSEIEIILGNLGEIDQVSISFQVGSLELSNAQFLEVRRRVPHDADDFSFIDYLSHLGYWKISTIMREMKHPKFCS